MFRRRLRFRCLSGRFTEKQGGRTLFQGCPAHTYAFRRKTSCLEMTIIDCRNYGPRSEVPDTRTSRTPRAAAIASKPKLNRPLTIPDQQILTPYMAPKAPERPTEDWLPSPGHLHYQGPPFEFPRPTQFWIRPTALLLHPVRATQRSINFVAENRRPEGAQLHFTRGLVVRRA